MSVFFQDITISFSFYEVKRCQFIDSKKPCENHYFLQNGGLLVVKTVNNDKKFKVRKKAKIRN